MPAFPNPAPKLPEPALGSGSPVLSHSGGPSTQGETAQRAPAGVCSCREPPSLLMPLLHPVPPSPSPGLRPGHSFLPQSPARCWGASRSLSCSLGHHRGPAGQAAAADTPLAPPTGGAHQMEDTRTRGHRDTGTRARWGAAPSAWPASWSKAGRGAPTPDQLPAPRTACLSLRSCCSPRTGAFVLPMRNTHPRGGVRGRGFLAKGSLSHSSPGQSELFWGRHLAGGPGRGWGGGQVTWGLEGLLRARHCAEHEARPPPPPAPATPSRHPTGRPIVSAVFRRGD